MTTLIACRPETEAYVTHLASLLCEGKLQKKLRFQFSPEAIRAREQNHRKPMQLRVLDACSGSGCISLLLHALISKHFHHLKIRGVDISDDAIILANENLERNFKKGLLHDSARGWGGPSPQISFTKQDILRPQTIGSEQSVLGKGFDVIISNPPYISQKKFLKETTRSVRTYEPKLALVPPHIRHPPPGFPPQEDIFYHRLIDMHQTHQSKVTLMEVGDAEQALRVVNHFFQNRLRAKWNYLEIWRDFPGQKPDPRRLKSLQVGDEVVEIKGQGKVRSVVIFRSIDWKKPRAQLEGIHRKWFDKKPPSEEEYDEPAPLRAGGFGNNVNEMQRWRSSWRQERGYVTTREDKIRENRARRERLERQGRMEKSRSVWKKGRNGARGRKVKVRLRLSSRSGGPGLGEEARMRWLEKSIVASQSRLHFSDRDGVP